jgi:hypothetical protein
MYQEIQSVYRNVRGNFPVKQVNNAYTMIGIRVKRQKRHKGILIK